MKLLQPAMAILLVFVVGCVTSVPDEFHGTVVKVVDGDTFDVEGLGRVRLADVDCPEMDTEAGRAAANYTISWLFGRTVWLDIDDLKGRDDYGRWICVVYLDENGAPDPEMNFNRMIVDSGHAVVRDFTDNEFNPADWWNHSSLQPGGGCAYVGSVKSNKYHYPDCEWAQKISPVNLICFSSPSEARSKGYTPCRVCKPP
ncbi:MULTISPECIES: thermonuclease family protein [Methanothrix]|uniref:thermonuclease family protein n=1 Tax=Methanothrix TaxID=2222 RepID=UPI000A495A37|nr:MULTISPECIES: thermonuclease family protein [Methanothrix]